MKFKAGDKSTKEEKLSLRAEILREAERLTTGDRNNQYGPPTQDFQRTANMLNALGYRGDGGASTRDLTGSDVARILACVKLSRSMWSPEKRDHWADLAGYAACGYECAEEENNR